MAEARKRWQEEARAHARAASREFREALKAVLPDRFWQHLKAARREALLSVRTVLDGWLEEETPSAGAGRS
ncbi:hypothetical protein [Thermoflexus sp.]|uniref:hypothetical protein n=1 Tax=Thermoflexus sp. TaxID=1969742 RepID=UPI002600B0A9|nr:hypothetical protein [Thermoflexus sp.]MDW8181704.1 hypothetical protein [Anaerolineae bacterium]MCS6963424.1 hypothetical protein [Thermoflexus sp.]MCS7352242.1 hypothetical protein [Thermoflexus sp.]MCX7689843.1 hypothetical protein [Thermoflexus sp.]MDW8185104.1 hypothetical protein [Anaerolineae bacterium]